MPLVWPVAASHQVSRLPSSASAGLFVALEVSAVTLAPAARSVAKVSLMICAVRFKLPWIWDGKPAVLLSRCQDETGYIQPTRERLVAQRGVNAVYHYNAIQPWGVAADGSVTNVAG